MPQNPHPLQGSPPPACALWSVSRPAASPVAAQKRRQLSYEITPVSSAGLDADRMTVDDTLGAHDSSLVIAMNSRVELPFPVLGRISLDCDCRIRNWVTATTGTDMGKAILSFFLRNSPHQLRPRSPVSKHLYPLYQSQLLVWFGSACTRSCASLAEKYWSPYHGTGEPSTTEWHTHNGMSKGYLRVEVCIYDIHGYSWC